MSLINSRSSNVPGYYPIPTHDVTGGVNEGIPSHCLALQEGITIPVHDREIQSLINDSRSKGELL